MKPYFDIEDTFYFNYEELIKASKIITNLAELKAELDPKQKRDYAGLGAIIFTFFLIAIVTALTIYTFIEIAYGQPVEFKNYTNNDLNFTIQYPSNWEAEYSKFKVSDFVDLSEVFFSLPDSENYYFEVGMTKVYPYFDTDTTTPKNTSLQQHVQHQLNRYLSSGYVKIIGQNEVSVGGNSGWKIEYTTPDTYSFEIFTMANGNFYTLSYIDEPSKVPQTLPLANKMVESFQILNN